MSDRKRIALFVAFPEMVHVRRILDGILSRCEAYDYDICVFASSTHLSFPHIDYMRGESNIYELANLDKFDGVIIDHGSMTGDKDNQSLKRLEERLQAYPDLPKCSLEMPLKGMKLIKKDNEDILREMCRHVIEKHGRKKICILTGPADNEVAVDRLKIFLDEIEKHGLSVLPEHIHYGDFWYFGGDTLARKIMNGEIEQPDAVICASDCMAIGLVDRLLKSSIRVPEDIAVVGIDASDEGAINPITISSYDTGEETIGLEAVDYLRSIMEPGAEILPMENDSSRQFHPGGSCGCETDPTYAMRLFRDSLYISSYNHADEDVIDHVNIGALMESYAQEDFTASGSAAECFKFISSYTGLLRPYQNFYLCLKENWLDMADEVYEGYPEKVRTFVAASSVGEEEFYGEEKSVAFETSLMHPILYKKRDKASVFYFSPVHFNGVLLGYAVLQRSHSTRPAINIVYRNWLRYINNALELIRTEERLKTLSIRDQLTGALNRRGMYERYKEMLSTAKEGDALFVGVLDMDGLKYINDTYGHGEGDEGIKGLCSVLSKLTRSNEMNVRSGGDEFFLIGIGRYNKEDEALRSREFADAVARKSEAMNKPYNLSASIGCLVFPDYREVKLDLALSEADEKMYNYKMRHRRHRSV